MEWTWGPETFVAIGTVLLAGGTFLLAASTRRLARESAREVQALSRPIISPREDTLRLWRDDEERRKVDLVVRNVGTGPALDIKFVYGIGRTAWWTSPDIAVIAAGADQYLHLPLYDSVAPGDYKHGSVTVQYNDLAGLTYATEITWGEMVSGPKILKVVVSDGYRDPHRPRPPMGDPFMARKTPLRKRLHGAARALWPTPGDESARLWTRLRVAGGKLRPQRTQTPIQRIRWGIRRAKIDKNREVPAHWPKSLGAVFLFGRRLRSGFNAYRNIR